MGTHLGWRLRSPNVPTLWGPLFCPAAKPGATVKRVVIACLKCASRVAKSR